MKAGGRGRVLVYGGGVGSHAPCRGVCRAGAGRWHGALGSALGGPLCDALGGAPDASRAGFSGVGAIPGGGWQGRQAAAQSSQR